MPGMEAALLADQRVRDRLGHGRDEAAAKAAVRFFAYREPSPTPSWYGSETWQHIMDAVAEIAPDPDSDWRFAMNNDTGSLKTGDEEFAIAQVIEIEGEGERRCVTSTAGTPGRFHAYFLKQKTVPLGRVRWRRIARAPISMHGQEPTNVAPTIQPVDEGDLGAGRTEDGLVTSWIETMRRHWAISALVVLGGAVVWLGSVTEGLDKFIHFLRKYFGS